MNLPAVISLDIWHSAVKCITFAAGTREKMLFPSVVTRARSISEDKAARAAALETVTVDGDDYFFSRTAIEQSGANSEAGMSENWITSTVHKALSLEP